jgi:geranylgeranyl pyrophosphate synthase
MKNIGRYNELYEVMNERGQRILRKFESILISNVKNPELRTILLDVSKWHDIFRPTLTSLSCEVVGGESENVDNAGLMFVLLSAALGIHDDIIDKSEENHFKTTIFGKYGLEKTLLVGDLLLIKSLSMIGDILPGNKKITIQNIIEVYRNLCVEMCEAEINAISGKQNLQNDLEFQEHILWGSMAEIEVCSRIGGILGGGKANEVQALGEYGRRLGFIRRLIDEVLDSRNLEGNLSHRLKFESVPLPILFAVKSSNFRFTKIESLIKKSNITKSNFRDILYMCIDSGAFNYIHKLAKNTKKDAENNLNSLKSNNACTLLSMLLDSFVDKLDFSLSGLLL